MLWDYFVPIVVTLIFDALVVALFNWGMFLGMRPGVSYTEQVTKGWVRGWLLVIALIIPWLALLVIFYIGYEYGGNPEVAYYMFFGGIALVLIYPGVNIALRIRSVYSSMPWKPIAQIALGWTVPFMIFWSAGFWVWFTQNYAIYKLTKVFGLNLSTGHYAGLAALAIAISMAVSKTLGIRVMSKKLILPLPDDAGGDLAQNALARSRITRKRSKHGKFSTLSILRTRYFPWMRLATIEKNANKQLKTLLDKTERTLSPLAKAKIGWGAAWVLFVWLAAQRFETHGLSKTDFWLYSIRFVLTIALLVSIGTGLIATLLMRGPHTQYGQFLKTAKTWVIGGLLGWIVGTPLGWGVVSLYQRFIFPLIRSNNITSAILLKPSQHTPLLIVGFFALLTGYIAVRGKFSEG
jgi:hypothetical protein